VISGSWLATGLLTLGALIFLGAAYSHRTLSPDELAERVTSSSCLKRAVIRNEREGHRLRPWSAADVKRAEENCEAERLLATQVKAIGAVPGKQD